MFKSYPNGNSNEVIISFVGYLENIDQKASCFSFEIALNSRRVLVGVLWMTAVMQKNLIVWVIVMFGCLEAWH